MKTSSIDNDIFEKVLEMQENGKSYSDILSSFPEHKNDVEDFLETINFLESQKNTVLPSKKALTQTINKIFPRHNIFHNLNVFYKKLFSYKGVFAIVFPMLGLLFLGKSFLFSFIQQNEEIELLAKQYESEIFEKLEKYKNIKKQLKKLENNSVT